MLVLLAMRRTARITKKVMTATTDHPAVRLKRDIGIFGASFLALNAMIGAGIFALPGKIAVNAGLLSQWLFLVVGALFITIVLTF